MMKDMYQRVNGIEDLLRKCKSQFLIIMCKLQVGISLKESLVLEMSQRTIGETWQEVNLCGCIIEYLYISMMNQYTPMGNTFKDSLLSRKVTKREYERLTEYAVGIGVENGFIQEGGTAKESFIPSWNGEGV